MPGGVDLCGLGVGGVGRFPHYVRADSFQLVKGLCMKSGLSGLVFWVALLLVTVSVAWAQAPAPQAQMTPAQALEVLGTIVPHYEGTVAEINAQGKGRQEGE